MSNGRNSHLIQVKLNLAAKYDRLAVQTRSRPKRMKFMSRAERYRRQVAQLQRE